MFKYLYQIKEIQTRERKQESLAESLIYEKLLFIEENIMTKIKEVSYLYENV